MPGYDRTGPMGAGPRTGWGLGRCGRPTDEVRPVEDLDQGEGEGWYGRRRGGGRGRGFGRGGGGRGQGLGRRWRAGQDLAGSDVTPRRRQVFLRRRIRELTAQLDRMKRLLSEDSREGAQDQA